jgi:hypothetical protein
MSEIHNIIDIDKLQRPILAIVRLAPENKERRDMAGMLTPFYQVTIDPSSMSPSKEFIRFGRVHGDEITGWRPVSDILVEEVLGEYTEAHFVPMIGSQGPSIELRPYRHEPQLKSVA